MDVYDKCLAIDEPAGHIKMSRAKIYGMVQRGKAPTSKIGDQWYFDQEGIDQLVKAHAVGAEGGKQ